MSDLSTQPAVTRPRKPPPPVWRRAYDVVEKTIAAPLTGMTGSEAFADTLALAARTRGTCLRMLERRSRRVLHLWNLPAASDLRQLQEQISVLQRQLADLPERLRTDRPDRPDRPERIERIDRIGPS